MCLNRERERERERKKAHKKNLYIDSILNIKILIIATYYKNVNR
jgi:hypothetical protein